MDKLTFEKIINNPATITSEEAVLLEELAQEFPYCQMAHLILANDSYQKKSMHYPKKLKKASTYILDRTVLHSLIHIKPAITSPENTFLNESSISKEKDNIIAEVKTLVTTQNIELLKEIENNLKQYKKHKEDYKEDSLEKSLDPAKTKPIAKIKLQDNSLSKTELGFGEEVTNKNITLLLDYLNEFRNEPANKVDQASIIDKFITTQPKIQQKTGNVYQEPENMDLSVPSTELKIELITENYALILTKQNKLEKAKEVYKKLMLKYPDKSAYFTLKLNELESL